MQYFERIYRNRKPGGLSVALSGRLKWACWTWIIWQAEAVNQAESHQMGPYGVASQAKWVVLYRRDALAQISYGGM